MSRFESRLQNDTTEFSRCPKYTRNFKVASKSCTSIENDQAQVVAGWRSSQHSELPIEVSFREVPFQAACVVKKKWVRGSSERSMSHIKPLQATFEKGRLRCGEVPLSLPL